jgi:hypothetical protein
MARSAKSWSRKARGGWGLDGMSGEEKGDVPTTFFSATKRASWSLPALLSWLTWMPVTSAPMLGVRCVTLALGPRRSLNERSASLPWS